VKKIFFSVLISLILTSSIYSQTIFEYEGYLIHLDSAGNFTAMDDGGDIWYTGVYDRNTKEIKSIKQVRYTQQVTLDDLNEWSITSFSLPWYIANCRAILNKETSSLSVNCPYVFELVKKQYNIIGKHNIWGSITSVSRKDLKLHTKEISSTAQVCAPNNAIFWTADPYYCVPTSFTAIFIDTEDDLCTSTLYTFFVINKI